MPPTVPFAVPSEVTHLQANGRGDSDSRLLGAAMGSSAFFLPLARSTATTGAWPFAHHHGVGMPGIHTGDDGPFGDHLRYYLTKLYEFKDLLEPFQQALA